MSLNRFFDVNDGKDLEFEIGAKTIECETLTATNTAYPKMGSNVATVQFQGVPYVVPITGTEPTFTIAGKNANVSIVSDASILDGVIGASSHVKLIKNGVYSLSATIEFTTDTAVDRVMLSFRNVGGDVLVAHPLGKSSAQKLTTGASNGACLALSTLFVSTPTTYVDIGVVLSILHSAPVAPNFTVQRWELHAQLISLFPFP